MDENQKHELHTANRFNKYYKLLLKKALQFLFSLSLFSFLLSLSSSTNSDHFLHYLKFQYFSGLLFPILSHALDRKYIFLICNGIVVVLAKNLSFAYSSPPSSDFVEDVVKAVTDTEGPVEDKEEYAVGSGMESLENVSGIVEEDEEEEEEEENGSSSTIIQGREEDDDDNDNDDQDVEESESLIPPLSTEDEGNEVNVSTEELNRRIDEFIRKMKEEIRIEAQQQQFITV